MSLIPKMTADKVLPYSSENAAASFYRWFGNLFDHAEGYSVLYDEAITDPRNRQELPFPCYALTQVDTSDPSSGFMDGQRDRNIVSFYINCYHNRLTQGSPRLLRRMKDQAVFCVKNAGRKLEGESEVVIEGIRLYDFSKTPIQPLRSALTLSGPIIQHFLGDGEVLEYELMCNFVYFEYFEEAING